MPDHRLAIDEFALSDEWLTQASKFMEASDAYSSAHANQSELELQLKTLQAQLALQVRSMPEEYGLEKITETAISDTVAVQDEVVALQRRIIGATAETDRLRNLVEAFRHRKSALENLSYLYRTGYYSEPGADPRERMRDRIAGRSSHGS